MPKKLDKKQELKVVKEACSTQNEKSILINKCVCVWVGGALKFGAEFLGLKNASMIGSTAFVADLYSSFESKCNKNIDSRRHR